MTRHPFDGVAPAIILVSAAVGLLAFTITESYRYAVAVCVLTAYLSLYARGEGIGPQ